MLKNGYKKKKGVLYGFFLENGREIALIFGRNIVQ
jgi:hypothetical protein